MDKSQKIKLSVLTIFARYAFHVWIILILTNYAIYFAFRFLILAAPCMTRDQVSNDSRCLYIAQNIVYEKGSRNRPHHGHACGTEVVLPKNHLSNTVKYLDPSRITSLCNQTTPTPTSTPTPISTTTPSPSHTPTPTATPSPTATPTPSPTPSLTPTPISTPTAKTTTTAALLTTSTPTPSLTPTNTPPTTTPAPTNPPVDVYSTYESGFGRLLANNPNSTPTTTATVQSNAPATNSSNKVPSVSPPFLSAYSGIMIRLTAIIGVFLLGLSLFIGIIRLRLFKLIQLPFTMRLHYIVGIAGAVFTLLHIFLVIADKNGWGASINISQVFIPSFRDPDAVSISLGSLALYLLAVVIISGIIFKKWAHYFGYISWNIIHSLSSIMLMAIIAHALRVGTDSTNNLLRFGYLLVFLSTIWTANKLIWRIFHLPKPKLLLNKTLPKMSPGSNISGVYYVRQTNNQNQISPHWILLNSGLVTIYGYLTSPVNFTGWCNVQGISSSNQGIPFISVTAISPVNTPPYF